jgi:hypothetical protein
MLEIGQICLAVSMCLFIYTNILINKIITLKEIPHLINYANSEDLHVKLSHKIDIRTLKSYDKFSGEMVLLTFVLLIIICIYAIASS